MLTSSTRPFVALPLLLAVLAGCSNDLPERETPENVVWLEQNWTEEQRQWYHHADQGTHSFLIPLEWFVALEQPGWRLMGSPGLLSDSDFLARIGFIPDAVNPQNPRGLPVGFAVGQTDPATGDTPVGLTCAACHAGHMTYKGTSLRYDGAPAMIAPDQLMAALFRSMAETNFNKRQFGRFADRVLGEEHTEEAEDELKKEFSTNFMKLIGFTFQAIESQKQQAIMADIEAGRFSGVLESIVETVRTNLEPTEGFARTDALTRIGNQVFALDVNRPQNFVPPVAPVSFPFIWSSSWFVWVQYDGSIMQPMVRNAGEALGVGALITMDANASDNFASSIPLDALHEIEQQLAGTTAAFTAKEFTGLRSPAWPEEVLGTIDRPLAEQGAALYEQHCQRCHLPAPNTDAFWSEQFWSITNINGERLLDVPLMPISEIGTDPMQATILASRTMDTRGLGINTRLFAGENCQPMTVTESATANYAFSLGAVVQEAVEHWYRTNNTSETDKQRFNGYLPNCLQAPDVYKARPLNGIWATSPFLHNGSVPNLYALLSPVDERPTTFYVGDLEFDPVNVGYQIDKKTGLFLFNTSKSANSNAGHEFNDVQRAGVIGPLLSGDERKALVEYLKTL
jgi:hypothetical protein